MIDIYYISRTKGHVLSPFWKTNHFVKILQYEVDSGDHQSCLQLNINSESNKAINFSVRRWEI